MKIYFVRHGETENFVNNLEQDENSGLSDNGIKQAKALAQRFKNIPIDFILTSPYQRARETAEIINKEIDKKIIVNKLLRETKKPTEIENKPHHASEIKEIRQLLYEHFGDPNWRYSDEENFFDLKKRGTKILKYLSTQLQTPVG